jgi:hypothetical protein
MAAKQRRVNWMVPGSWSPVSSSRKAHDSSRSFREGILFLLLTIQRKTLYTGGGTYILNGTSCAEHVDFGDKPFDGVVGKDQHFTVRIDGDTFMQAGTLSNGVGLSETYKRVN